MNTTVAVSELRPGQILRGGWVVLSSHRKDAGWELVYARYNQVDMDAEVKRKGYHPDAPVVVAVG